MSTSAAPLRNGILPSTVQPLNEASEYEKILRIRDEVFSGSHPRLTVPTQALRVASSQTPLAVSQSRFNVPSPFPPSASPNRAAAEQLRREDETQAPTRADGANVPSSQPASNVSEFDPVLLTKSDDLVRAEYQLKRQRLEKALRDQFEQKRLDARRKPAPSEAKPDFDLQAVLAKALEIAKPPSSKDDVDASDSFDANSFYSSRAPDSTPENGPQSPSAEDGEEGEAYEPPGPPAVSAVMGSPLQHGTGDEASTNNATFALGATSTKPSALPPPTAMDLDDEEEEGEYSPPEAMAQYPTSNAAHPQAMQDSRDPRNRPLRRYSELDDNGRRPVSPSEANMRIVRNQITSPIAPVPSRVSPLAVAKGAPFLQNGRQRRSPRIGRAGCPPSPDDTQTLHPKKKRKLEKRNEKKGKRNGKVSPDAFLKEEQVSPPPFHDVQPLGSGRPRPMGGADQPITLDEEPTQEIRYMPAPERYVDSPSRPLPRQVEQLMPLSEPRAVSRAGLRPLRDEPDLRRVASMHNMRVDGTREYTDPYYDTPTRGRAISYARMGSPAIRESSRLAPVEYEQSPREVRVMRTPAPAYREMYEEGEPTIRYATEPMPPPPIERIVIDQYGRRFREIIQERPSVAPRATPVRRTEMDQGYEHYRAARSASVFVDTGPERAYVSDMLPPPVTYRRPGGPPHSSAVPGSVTREYFEPGSLPRSSSVQVMDRAPRSTIYPDERPDFREPARMGSVRPPAMRYEEPQPMEMMTRAQSVRPAVHGRSVFLDGRQPVGHEYVPAEQARYRVVEPDERFMDAPDREMETMQDPVEGGRRVMERY
ncbi:hypothetical protein A1O3_10068 [Capronia epimyces CBS 606.96]|uniref:Uncharacterized protein n=1 Tax=Capronia epimyces CBS 606.96 TaxID=1182542 RepID=W9XIY8_9EURO|nr:uncharacterized protein A1O3_10068 [Capronia epimyces CBS 606.96]EXJ76911.1 hypothetical protein A1O3_10068 [Capronia epimyces CBS 606.96]